MEHFLFWMVYLVLCTVILIFLGTFHFWGRIFGDLDDIFGILYGDYTIWDDYFVFLYFLFVFWYFGIFMIFVSFWGMRSIVYLLCFVFVLFGGRIGRG